MNISTSINDYVKALSANSTDGSFTSLVATVTEPTGVGVNSGSYNDDAGGRQARNTVLFAPFGVGTANDTFAMRVTGWSKISTLWVPITLGEFTRTLGAATGVAATGVLNTDKFVDTIVSVLSASSTIIVSPADDTRAYVLVDALGSEKIQLTFDMLSGATSANALYKQM